MRKWWIAVSALLFAGLAQAQSMGSLQVNGTPGKYQVFQKVKAVRCNLAQRGACDPAVFFNLNAAQALPAGTYLVGFENTLYPDYVTVDAGRNTVLTLERITVPAKVRGDRIRIYRDFSALVEQKKIYMAMYSMNRHFFRLDKENFGDLYLTGSWERDFVQRFTYEVCPKIESYGNVPSSAKSLCQASNNAKSPLDLREQFDFAADGTFKEMWVTAPGDIQQIKHPRYLVGTPMSADDFVSVFPGAYKVQAEGKGQVAVSIKVGEFSQSSKTYGFSLNPGVLFNSLNAEGCSSARTWKTDSRAYCTSDQQEGCNRSQAESCESM